MLSLSLFSLLKLLQIKIILFTSSYIGMYVRMCTCMCTLYMLYAIYIYR